MFSEEVKNKDGVVKTVVASNKEELAEQVKAVKAEQSERKLDINDPADANEIVSPGNKHSDFEFDTVVGDETDEEETDEEDGE